MRIPTESRLIALVHKEEPINTWEVQIYNLNNNEDISRKAYNSFEEALEIFIKAKDTRSTK